MKPNPIIFFYISEEDQLKIDYRNFKVVSGAINWTYQTYSNIRGKIECKLVDYFPDEGILIAHRDYLPDRLKEKKLLIICIKPDRRRSPFAQIHVVQNQKDKLLNSNKKLWESCFIHYWSQPDIIKSKTSLKQFENIGFFGLQRNLVSDFKTSEFKRRLKKLNLTLKIIPKERWNDYSNIDAVLAVRSFRKDSAYNKPATKLYNAWMAGVPVIAGPESAYRAERRSKLDYIEINSVEGTINALKELKENAELRKNMIENGFVRAKEFTVEKITQEWVDFINNTAIPYYKIWREMPAWKQNLFFFHRFFSYKLEGLKIRITSRWVERVYRGR